jgi:hypothetical protein
MHLHTVVPCIYIPWYHAFAHRGTMHLPTVVPYIYKPWYHTFTYRGTMHLHTVVMPFQVPKNELA